MLKKRRTLLFFFGSNREKSEDIALALYRRGAKITSLLIPLARSGSHCRPLTINSPSTLTKACR